MRGATVGLTMFCAALPAGCGADPGPPAVAEPGTGGTATCEDATGDSTGAVDLVLTTVAVAQRGVEVAYSWQGQAPGTTSVTWSTTVSSADGTTARELGYETTDGGTSRVFASDVGDLGGDRHVDSAGARVVESGSGLRVTYPRSVVADLGEGWGWRSTVAVAGSVVDECPEPS